MMLAEVGWPATLCLVVGVMSVFFVAMRRIRQGRSRFLRMGCVVAALLLCLHGLFDVPGHRVGLAWAAILLLASSLRHPSEDRADTNSGQSALGRWCWRGLGGILALAGLFLIHAHWKQQSFLPSVRARTAMNEAKALYARDQAAYESAVAEGRDYEPLPWEDPLEVALLKIKEVIDVAPLDPYPHYVRGSLALHYDDKPSIVSHAFPIQRRLEPRRVNVAMEQARAWSKQDPDEVLTLWKEAMRRATSEQVRSPDGPLQLANTYQRALQTAGGGESLVSAALNLAGADPALLAMWAGSAPVAMLDREMPRLLSFDSPVEARKPLFETWRKRGSGKAAADFAKSHPELGLVTD
jgi:hypothetical protein